tara:strand:- start:185 stop:472 length:288 start_codon:yes stop_codon:yes gene_type:complete
MNYSKWNEQFDLVLNKLESSDNSAVLPATAVYSLMTASEEARMEMLGWAQDGCPNPEPDAEDCERIYRCVMSNIGEMGLGDKPFYTDVYNIELNV